MTRKRADSSHVLTAIAVDALRGKKPPEHLRLRDCDMVFWDYIIEARAEWTNIDLVHAANLARVQSDIDRLQSEIDENGDIVESDRGYPIINPKHKLLNDMHKRSLELSRMLQVHAAATIGESKDNRGKNKAKRDALNAQDALNDDDLIARPFMQ